MIFYNRNIITLNDGEILSQNKRHLYSDSLIQLFETSNDRAIKCSFVGFVLQRDSVIVSYPKHYDTTNSSHDDMVLLAKLLLKQTRLSGFQYKDDLYNNFPVFEYLNVCEYYRKFGLYVERSRDFSEGYDKKVDWKRTIQSQNKIISGYNLLFLPFVVENKNDISVFVTECMKAVLFEGYFTFAQYFEVGIRFLEEPRIDIFGNIERAIIELNKYKEKINRDDILSLIDSLIGFLIWRSRKGKEILFVIKDFSVYWQQMTKKFLQCCFVFDDSKESFYFDQRQTFYKVPFSEVEHSIMLVKSSQTRQYKVRYDHLFIDEIHKRAFLFDSKYYIDVYGLDYKQFSYYFTLKDYIKRIDASCEYRIFNGLIMPTENSNVNMVHIDTRNPHQHEYIQELFITEHYINIKWLIKWFIEN